MPQSAARHSGWPTARCAGPEIKWQPGRSDKVSGESCGPDGRLPDAAQGAKHLRHIFYRMGFNDQEIVALSGAHSLGRCHPDRSGFKGPWTNSPTTFSNLYFQELLDTKWCALASIMSARLVDVCQSG